MVKQQMNLVEIEAMNSLRELTLEELDNVLGAGGGVIQIHFIKTSLKIVLFLEFIHILKLFTKYTINRCNVLLSVRE